jgi:hypothetical protein
MNPSINPYFLFEVGAGDRMTALPRTSHAEPNVILIRNF